MWHYNERTKPNKEASWLYAELLQIMCSEEKMSNKIFFTYIYFIVVPCDAVLVETWGCCPSFQLSQKVNPTLWRFCADQSKIYWDINRKMQL